MALRLSWRVLSALAGSSIIVGCSSIVGPDLGRLGGGSDGGGPPGIDAGLGVDAGPTVRVDSGPMAGVDSGPPTPVDGGPPTPIDGGPRPVDGGPRCDGPDRCDGEVLVTCRSGVESREPCTDRDAYCAGNRCESWVCEPGSRECGADFRSVVTCSERGDSETRTACDLGCDPATDSCVTVSPTCADLPQISLGASVNIDLCRARDDDTHVPAEGCPTTAEADVGDRVLVLQIDRPTDVVIELTDIDFGAAIDTLLYVRRVCDDPDTQVVCSDDVECSTSTVPGPGGCSGSVDVRQSRIETRLAPGLYYIVADAFDYTTDSNVYRCGVVRLSVTEG